MIKKTPENIKELKIMANNKSSWRERLEAIEILKDYNCEQSRNIITKIALHDPVLKVKEAAVVAAEAFGIEKGGKPIKLTGTAKGNLIKDIDKKLTKVQKELGLGYSYLEIKEKFSQLYPVAYDIYEGDKGDDFDKWLKNKISSLSK